MSIGCKPITHHQTERYRSRKPAFSNDISPPKKSPTRPTHTTCNATVESQPRTRSTDYPLSTTQDGQLGSDKASSRGGDSPSCRVERTSLNCFPAEEGPTLLAQTDILDQGVSKQASTVGEGVSKQAIPQEISQTTPQEIPQSSPQGIPPQISASQAGSSQHVSVGEGPGVAQTAEEGESSTPQQGTPQGSQVVSIAST